MDKLKEILSKNPDERTEKDLEYLEEYSEELNDEQKTQLDNEAKELSDDDIIEEHNAEFISKSIVKKDSSAKPVTKNFTAKVKDLGDGLMEAIISSQSEDRHGEIIDMKGLDVKKYMTNPIISYLHDHSVPSIGRTHSLKKTRDGKLIAKFEWAIKNNLKAIHDKAVLMYELYKEGFQFAFSIEFIPVELNGNTYTKSEMVGFAPVVVPANPDALLLAKKKGLDKEYLKAYNISNMDIKELIERAEKDGVDSLTLAEVKFLQENKDDLTANQIKSLSEIFSEKKEDKKDDTNNETVKALKALKDEVAELKKADKPVHNKDINNDNPNNKNLNNDDENVSYKMFGNTKVDNKYLDEKGEVKKEVKFLYYVQAVQNKDFSKYNDIIGKAAMVTSGSNVLPPAEFLVEIERLEEEYGVAEKDATVRRSTTGNGITYVLGDDDLEVYDTAEAGVKRSTKLTYAQKTLAWKKFAAILPITDELLEDAAFNLWADATKRFARAYARKADELVFTANLSGGANKKGIMFETGVNLVTISGDSIEDITYDDVVDMVYGVPSSSANGGKFYLNREIIGVLMKIKDEEGRPLWLNSPREGAPATILNKPYVETEVLPSLADDGASTKFFVFGNLRYVTLGMRTDMQIKIFDTGNVGDPDDEESEGNDFNLLTQDMQAMRAVKRMNAVVRFPAAFSVIQTGSGS